MRWEGLDDFLSRVSDRLDPPRGEGRLTEYGDLDFLTPEELAVVRPAAVLVGVIPRKSGPTALLTLRPDTMANHAGQVAFPGGKIDPIDVDEVAAALHFLFRFSSNELAKECVPIKLCRAEQQNVFSMGSDYLVEASVNKRVRAF